MRAYIGSENIILLNLSGILFYSVCRKIGIGCDSILLNASLCLQFLIRTKTISPRSENPVLCTITTS